MLQIIASLFISVSFANQECKWSFANSEQDLKNYNYAIVPGIINELVPFYMVDYRIYLLKKGVSSQQIHRFNNSTFTKPTDSAQKMYHRIAAVKNKKPWVIVAHSRGALEVMYLLRDYEEKLNIKKIYLIQGSLDGASFGSLLYSVVRTFTDSKYFKDRAEAFSQEKIREDFSVWTGNEDLWDKVFFITSEIKPKKIPRELILSANLNMMVSSGKPGDGVLQIEDQVPYFLKDKNICKKVYNAHHGTFVKGALFDFKKRKKLRLFISSLFLGGLDRFKTD